MKKTSTMRRFPVVMQHDSMQCGVACLTAVARHYGGSYNLSDVADVCHATVEGVSMQALCDGAKALGIQTKVARTKLINIIAWFSGPMILHWDQNHFVVLYKISKNGTRFHISDPAKGRVCYSREEFLSHWASDPSAGNDTVGIVMTVTKTIGFKPRPPKPYKPPRGFMYVKRYLSNHKVLMSHLIVGLALGCVLQLIMPFLTQAIVDNGIRFKNINLIWLILLGELMIVFGRAATDFVRRWLLLHISMRVNVSLIRDFLWRMMMLPMTFFDTKLTGDLLQRINDHTRVQNFLTNDILGMTFSLLSFVVFGAVLAFYNWVIFAVFVGGSVLYGVWLTLFLHRRRILDYDLFDVQARNQNIVYQMVTNMPEIKLQGCEVRRSTEWEDTQADLMAVQMRALKLRQIQEAGGIFINELKNIVITVLAATSVIAGDMSLGAMLAVQYIIGQLNSPVDQLMNFILALQDVQLSLERIDEVRNAKDESNDTVALPQQRPYELELPDRNIRFEHLTFKYDPHSRTDTLSDISLHIPQGNVTAIVGASGSGKSTLIKLMLNYFNDFEGSLTLGGTDLRKYRPKEWRSKCGVVMQDGVIFSESIARNIAAEDKEIDFDRLQFAAKAACIHDFIMELPRRYGTRIGRDGVGLSLGQKQRILIARAIYKNPELIILDEATNSLDAANERAIVDNLKDFYRGRTVVVVAHRLSTVRDADQIVVLDHGRIVERGNHESLTQAKGHYYNLIKNQLELGS